VGNSELVATLSKLSVAVSVDGLCVGNELVGTSFCVVLDRTASSSCVVAPSYPCIRETTAHGNMVAASTTPFVECSLFEVRSQLECKLQPIEDNTQCLNRVVETVLAHNQQEVDEGVSTLFNLCPGRDECRRCSESAV
jgi:hypothetical protein